MVRAQEILDQVYIEVDNLVDELRFEYQHSPNYSINPTAFSRLNDTGDWIMTCCPNHHENRPSFGISKEPPYHCNCFYCGYLGTLDKVIEIAFNLEEGEGIKFLFSHFLFEEKRHPVDIDRIIDEGRTAIEIPCLDESELIKFDDAKSKHPWDYAVGISYLKRRGINEHTIHTYEVRVDVENRCVVIPQRTRTGKLRFIQKRKIGDQFTGAKYINEGVPIKKDIVFGLHFIDKIKHTPHRIRRVRLVESAIDVMSNYQVGIPAVALNGKLLFPQQLREIQLAGIEVIDVMLDNDKAGRQASKEVIRALVEAGLVVNEVLYPPQLHNSDKQDSNTLLRLGLLDKLDVRPVSLLGPLY